jgi:hypothetical protein
LDERQSDSEKPMSPEQEKRLELEIEQELKALPELPAPTTLTGSVMAALAQRAAAPWYSRPWMMWPVTLRVVSLVLLVAISCGIWLGAMELWASPPVTAMVREAGRWFSGASALWRSLEMLVGILVGYATSLKPAVLAGAVTAVVLAYGSFLLLTAGCLHLGRAAIDDNHYETNH